MIVCDSSCLVKYLLREEGWELVEQHLKQGVVTLDHARKEVLNSIWKHCWIRRIVDRDLAAMLRNAFEKLVDAGVLLIEDEEKYIGRAFHISLEHGVTLYDSLFLSQAINWNGLLTSDLIQKQIAEKLNLEVVFIP